MSDEAMTSREQAPLNVAGPEPGLPLRDIPIVFVTRFSFFGKSSWKSEASRNREILFQPDRLKLRLKLLSAITLPSLAAQTSRDFHHFILTSRDLPEWAAVRLRAECARFHGDPSRYSIIAERPMPAPAALRQFLDARYGGHTVAQVALDDDDGLAACASVASGEHRLGCSKEWRAFRGSAGLLAW